MTSENEHSIDVTPSVISHNAVPFSGAISIDSVQTITLHTSGQPANMVASPENAAERQAHEANYRFFTAVRPLGKINLGTYQSPTALQKHRSALRHYAQ